MSETSECGFVLPGEFPDGREVEELRMMARFLLHLGHKVADMLQGPPHSHDAMEEVRRALHGDGTSLASTGVREILSAYNALRLSEEPGGDADGCHWPCRGLQRLAGDLCPHTALLPPPTPCEYVDDALAWSCFGMHDRREAWLGHGYFFRQRPECHRDPVENAAGSAMNDFDMLEDGFVRLRNARVVAADRAQLRRDFTGLAGADDGSIDAWLLGNCAYMSAGQAARLDVGGDHHALLGLDALEGGAAQVLDSDGPRKAGLRMRSGGRAATFFVGDTYSFSGGALRADMLDVKGIGTHTHAEVGERTTGLLNLTDALLELAFQRLIQRLVDLDEEPWCTVRYYALIDTGLQYRLTNPATGWESERCVLLVRQPQSRLLDDYDAFNFSGVAPSHVLEAGPGAAIKALLRRSGLSAEFVPSAPFREAASGGASSRGVEQAPSSSELFDGEWNLQLDAPCTHLMDFSDYYVLPDSPLPAAWRMSWQAFGDAFALERQLAVDRLTESPALCQQLFGVASVADVLQALSERRSVLSRQERYRCAAAAVDDANVIVPGKPRYCMCWFMELNDSEVACWAFSASARVTAQLSAGEEVDEDVFATIDAWLPPLPSSSAE